MTRFEGNLPVVELDDATVAKVDSETLAAAVMKPFRHCDGCTLCCYVMPIKGATEPFEKAANTRCPNLGIAGGCRIYSRRPKSCRVFVCRWLCDESTTSLKRPDKSHYVIDATPDYVEAYNQGETVKHELPVVQIWVDPNHWSEVRNDSALRRWLNSTKQMGLLRNGSDAAVFMAPPSVTGNSWKIVDSNMVARAPHSAAEVAAVCGEEIAPWSRKPTSLG